jgi:SAM-dependent methyltransferase
LRETFQPIAVKAPDDNKLLFGLRCALDLQLLTIYRFLAGQLKHTSGSLLDVGAGEAPWRSMLAQGTSYIGVDIHDACKFGMKHRDYILFYDGKTLPFESESFDNVLCTEVLEHVPDPKNFMAEIHRVLKPGAKLILTVPWSARLHHLPHDYHRFTRFGLSALLEAAGFNVEILEERGNDIMALTNKLIVVLLNLLRPAGGTINLLWRLPLGVFMLFVAMAFVVASHLSLVFKFGGLEDPLGYAVLARKK